MRCFFTAFLSLLCVSCITLPLNSVALSSINDKEDKMGDVQKIQMSYRIEGAYSPYKFVEVEISGDGSVRCSVEYYPGYKSPGKAKYEQNFSISEDNLKAFIELFNKMDFFNMEVEDLNKDKITVKDVGISTICYKTADNERTISYGFVRDRNLKELTQLFWVIFKTGSNLES